VAENEHNEHGDSNILTHVS